MWYGGDSTHVKDQLINITSIFSTDGAFAALNTQKQVITWGASDFGGNSTEVQKELMNIKTIYPR